MEIYVGNIAYNMTTGDLSALFSPYGRITNIRIITDHYTRQSKGFGYIVMRDRQQGIMAIRGLHGRPVNRRPLIVKEARPRDERLGLRW